MKYEGKRNVHRGGQEIYSKPVTYRQAACAVSVEANFADSQEATSTYAIISNR